MKKFFLIFIAWSVYLIFPNISHTADIIITVVGTGTAGYSGNNGPAIEAQTSPTGVFADPSGDLFIAEFANNCIRKVDKATGIITTVAGVCGATGGYSGNGIAATSAILNGPHSVFVNSNDIFIPDFNNHCVRKVNKATGIITDAAGVCGSAGGYSGDGNSALSAQLYGPYSVFVNGAGDIFIADYYNSRIRKVNGSDGKISTFAGTGTAGYSGDGDPATLAQINQARGVFGDASGNIYIADTFNHRIRKVDPAGYIGSIVNAVVTPPNPGYSGDSGPASIAQLNIPEVVFVDPSGNIFITEFGNHTIRKVDFSSNYISTVAGTGTPGYSGDCGNPTSAQLNNPSGVFVDSSGIFIADTLNYRIRKVTPPIPPKLTTVPVSGVTATTANSGGNIICDGGSTITEKGVCWSTSPNPTTSNSKLINGSPSPNFSSSVTGLSPNTTYYLRAYAKNGVGTAYGNEFTFTTLVGTFCDTVTEIPKTECESLLDLYNSTNGPGWTDKTGWNVTNTPCSWYGVSCSGGHVESIVLSGNNLSGTIPPNLNLLNLITLILDNNQLSGTVPDFSSLTSLAHLDLHKNQLSGNIPNFNMSSLIDIALDLNQLDGPIPNFSLPNLVSLGLRGNNLTGAIPNFNTPNLKNLWLDYNQLSGTIPNLNWAGFTYLFFNNNCGLTAYDAVQATVLTAKDPNWQQVNPACSATDCSLVTLTGIPTTECESLITLYNSTNGSGWTNKTGWNINNMPCSWYGVICGGGHVDAIILNNNNLTGTIPNLNLPNLTLLQLGSNQLSGSIPNFNLPNLSSLVLSGNQLIGIIPNFNMPNMTMLGLDNNQLSGNIPNFNMPNLTQLSLWNNQLTGTIPNFNLPNLTSLGLQINQLSGTVPNLNWSGFTTLLLNHNCGLTAYDAAQATVLTAKDPDWNVLNPSCLTYIVNFTVNPASGGTVNLSSQTVASGGLSAEVMAVEMAGYTFVNWKDQNSNIITTSPTLPPQTITTDMTYTAYFAPAVPQITGIAPAAGLANTATNLIITGYGFPAANAQAWLSSSSATPASTIGLVQITISSSSATQIIGTTPANLAVGTYYVFVHDPIGSIWSTAANSMSNVFTVNSVGNIYTWTGNYDQNWYNESNWLLGGSPAPTGYRPSQPSDTAIIPPVISNRYPVLQNSVTLNKFTMALGTSLTISSPGMLQVNDTAEVRGVITLENYGNIQVPPSGTFSINAGGVLKLNGGGVRIHPLGSLYRFKNLGTIEWKNGSISPVYEPGNPPCSFNNEGTIAVTDAYAYLMNCNFTNSKNLAINNGILTVSDGSFTNAGTGLIEVAFNSAINFSTSSTNIVLTNKGTLKGRGTIGGTGFTFVNEGIVDPGWLDAGVLYFDPMNITGNYTQTSTGKLHIDANSSGNDFVHVSGTAQLNGTLEFAPSGTFIPVGSFDVLKSDGSMNGTLTIASLSGYTIFGGVVPGTPNIYRINIGTPDYVWTGSANDNWSDAANWESGAIPSLPTHSVVIPMVSAGKYYPHINSDVHIGGITIEQNASLTIHSGYSFNIHGSSANNGTLTLLGGNVILADNAVFTNTGDLIFFTPSGATSKFADAPASQGKLVNTGMIINQSFSGVLDVFDFEQIPTDSTKGISIQSGDLRFASKNAQNTFTIGASAITGSGTLIFGEDAVVTYPMIILRDNTNINVLLRWVSGVVEKASDITSLLTMTLSKNAEIGSSVFKKLYSMDISIANSSVVTLKDGEFYLGSKANFKVDGGILYVEGKMSFYSYDDDATLTGTLVNNGTVKGTGILSFTPNPSDPKPAVVFTNNATISPGLSPGKLTIQGDYAHGSGTLLTELGLPTSGMYDELAVVGNATLSGTLTANFPSGFTPAQDSDFRILTATGSLTGTYATVNLPIIPGFHWNQVNYVSTGTGSYAELQLRKDTSPNALEVVVYPTDGGTVSGANGLIDCGTVCSLNTYPVNTTSLMLNASATSTYEFDHWEVNGVVQTDTQPSITVSTSIANIVKAIFRLKTATHTLSVSVSPSGSGTVSLYPLSATRSDMMCPPDCTITVASGTKVSLYAMPNSGNTFLYWSGAASGSSASTEITVDSDKSVTAYFSVYVPPYEPPYYPPEEPDEPDTPDDPDNPDTPDQPDTPVDPDEPDTPDDPDNPDTPDQPDTPDTPDEPDTPDNPDYPSYEPPDPPALVSPAYQEIVKPGTVMLTGTPFKGSGDQIHLFTHWLVAQADSFYRPGNNKDALFDDYIASYSSGNLTSYSFADVIPGMKYLWKTGYIGSGNPNIAWSGESSFIVGTPLQSLPVDIPPGETSAQYLMFSIPYWLQNEDAVAALNKIIGNYDTKMFRIGGYDAAVGGFVEYGQGLKIVPGRAYWILSRNGVKLTVTGVPVNSDQTIGIVLDKGWNMIAPPNNADYDRTLLDIVVYDDNGNIVYQGSVSDEASANYIDADLWLWAGSENDYVPTTVLEKGKGCWIKAKYPGVVLNFSPQARINASSVRSARRSSSSEKPPMPMENTGFTVDSDNIDAGGGCFIDSLLFRTF